MNHVGGEKINNKTVLNPYHFCVLPAEINEGECVNPQHRRDAYGVRLNFGDFGGAGKFCTLPAVAGGNNLVVIAKPQRLHINHKALGGGSAVFPIEPGGIVFLKNQSAGGIIPGDFHIPTPYVNTDSSHFTKIVSIIAAGYLFLSKFGQNAK